MNFSPNYYMGQNASNQGIIWVNGLEGAKGFQLMPGTNAILLDSENDGMMYIKSVDGIGMGNIRTFKYEEVKTTKPDYITRTEFDELLKAIREGNNGKSTIQSAKSKSDRADA